MKCDHKLLSDYRDGELSPEQRRVVDEHLITCAECRKVLQDYEGISRAIRSLRRYEAPGNLVSAVYDRIESERFGSRVGLNWSGALRLGGLLAAALVLVFAGSNIFRVGPVLVDDSQARATSPASIYLAQSTPTPIAAASQPTPDIADRLAEKPPAAAPRKPAVQTQVHLEAVETSQPEHHVVEPPGPRLAAAETSPVPEKAEPAPVISTVNASPTAVVVEPKIPAQNVDSERPEPTPISTPSAERAVAAAPTTATPSSTNSVATPSAGQPTRTPSGTPGGVSIAAIVEITPTTTVSATIACSLVPQRGFGLVYSGNVGTRERLGCAVSKEKPVNLVQEAFEGGQVFWRSDTLQIYVLTSKGTWKAHKDTWAETDLPVTPLVPPEGKFAPVRGIGKLWTEDLTVRADMGWALEAERGYSGAVQEFEKGAMVWSDLKAIYVLYADGTWQRFADTYSDPSTQTEQTTAIR